MAASVLAATVHASSGEGAFVDNSGNVNSMSFKASVDDAGNVYGNVQDVITLPGKNIKFHGINSCFALISPNTAVFGGVIDSSNDPSNVGQYYVVMVVDNSKLGIPDQIDIEYSKAQPDCLKANVTLYDLIRGSNNV